LLKLELRALHALLICDVALGLGPWQSYALVVLLLGAVESLPLTGKPYNKYI